MTIAQFVECHAQRRPHAPATVCGARRRDWRDLWGRVARLAGGLRACGLEPGDRVALLGLASDRYLESLAAILRAGGVVVPLDGRWEAARIAGALAESGATMLLLDGAFIGQGLALAIDAPAVRTVIHSGDGAAPWGVESSELLLASAPASDGDPGAEDLAGIFYTAGTTGAPKGVMLAHRALWAAAMALREGGDIGRETVFLQALPLCHPTALACSAAVWSGGGAQVLLPAFDPEEVLAAVVRERVTHMLLLPAMIEALVAHPAFAWADLSSLKLILYGAAPIADAVLEHAMEALPRCSFVQIYGQAELAGVATILTRDAHADAAGRLTRPRSAGRPVRCNEIEIVDRDGAELPRGAIGEIRVRGATAMQGYWRKPLETAAALRGGWVHTGDAGYMDEEGNLFVIDRLEDVIFSGGETISSLEVENAIAQHPAVAQCAVIGLPHEHWGEAIHAIIVPRPGHVVTADAIIAHCRRLIAGYKCPGSVSFRSEELPLSPTGQPLKRALRPSCRKGRCRQLA